MIARPSHLDFHCDFDTAGDINNLWLNTTNYAVEVTYNVGDEEPERPTFVYDVNFYTDGSFTQEAFYSVLARLIHPGSKFSDTIGVRI